MIIFISIVLSTNIFLKLIIFMNKLINNLFYWKNVILTISMNSCLYYIVKLYIIKETLLN